MGIQVLGPLAVDGSGRLSPRDRAVLQALTVRHGGSVTADELVDAVWGEHPPASAHKNLQSCVVRLRKALGPDAIETTVDGYRLGVPVHDLDSRRFEEQVERARELLELGEPDRAVYVLEEALRLWRGQPFADLDWAPARREAGRLEEVRRDAEELLLDAQLRRGRAREVLPRAHEMVRTAPLRERRWELLALAQYRTGAQGEALRSIRQLRAVLARDLGIDPAPEIVDLERSILNQDPSLEHDGEALPPSATCPWQGLQAYGVAEADRFFGRDAEIEAGLAILADGRLLALVGPSGSGKSSLMRAGIGARLQQRGTRCVAITPGRYPAQTLSALDHLGGGDAVLVDQAEELFTLCEDPEETHAFLDRLVEAAVRRPVVVALRADRLADLTAYPAFSRLVERGLSLVGGLDEAGLRLAVTGPARQAGLILEPGLVDLLVTEVRDDPGALPLLSHALLETWKRREGSTLTVDGYRASGGIHGAVAQSAERLYAEVEPGHRDTLRELVLRLLSPGSEGEPVRTRVPRRLIGSDPEQERLIEMLVAARLVTSDDGVLEITHESLARAWPRLRGWLEDDVDGRRILHHLSSTADAWDTLGRPSSELYRGVRLTRALDWRASTGATLTAIERDFLDASREQAEVEEQTAVERARAQARLIRRLRVVLGGAVCLLILALVAGWFATGQSNRAGRSEAEARVAAEAAQEAAVSKDARQVGARAQAAEDLSLALLLAAAGARLEVSPETRLNLTRVLNRTPRLIRSGPPAGNFVEQVITSPDGRWLAASDDKNRMHLYDAASHGLLRSYDGGDYDEQQAFMRAAFSPDSSLLAVVEEATKSTEPVRLLDPGTMQPARALSFPSDQPTWGVDVAFSADGRYLAATVETEAWPTSPPTGKSFALVWDVHSLSDPPVRIPTHRDVAGVALSPDGSVLYTSEPLTAYEVATGKQLWRREEIWANYGTLDINRAGTLLALSDYWPPRVADMALLVDVDDGSVVARLRGHRAYISDIMFSSDGSLVGSLDSAGEVILWDTYTGRLRRRWGSLAGVGIAFSPDADVVYNGYGPTMLRAWDVSATATYLQRVHQVGEGEVYRQADFSPDGRTVAYGWHDDRDKGWVRFVDVESGASTQPTRFPVWHDQDPWTNGLWAPDGRRYAGYWCEQNPTDCVKPGTVIAVDPTTGRVVTGPTDVVDDDSDIWLLAHLDGGESLLVADSELNSRMLDAKTLRPLGKPFNLFSFCPCGATEIGDGSTAYVWDWTGGGTSTRLRTLDVDSGEIGPASAVDLLVHTSVASPDGTTMAVAGRTGVLATIDVSTGRVIRKSSSLGAPVFWLDYSADGDLLVSGAEDGSVGLWDAATLDLLGTVRPPDDGRPTPASVQFIGDTHDVTVASMDGAIYRWETDVDRALDFACQMAGRDLTKDEWAQYLPDQPYQSVCPEE